MSKIDQIHLRAVMLCMSKMLKIDQIHLRAVMLCMSKMSKMGKEHTDTFFIIPFLIWYHLNVMLSMSKIDQIHLRAVMLCMSKMRKEHTHTFWLITSLIFKGFSIRKKFWKAETQGFPTIPSNTMYIKACWR